MITTILFVQILIGLYISLAIIATLMLTVLIVGRELGFYYDEGYLYNYKWDWEIRLVKTRHGKYERKNKSA